MQHKLNQLKRFEQFFTRLGEDDCWLWTGACDTNGYGQFDQQQAHRFAFKKHSGKEIPKSKWVLHSCSNKPCINPKHLYLGSPAENTDFAWKNNECRIGVSHILTKKEVLEIREIWARAVIIHPLRPNRRLPSQEELAKRYGVSASCISNTVTEKTGKGILRGNSGCEGEQQCPSVQQ